MQIKSSGCAQEIQAKAGDAADECAGHTVPAQGAGCGHRGHSVYLTAGFHAVFHTAQHRSPAQDKPEVPPHP